jgi:5'-nucleotidase
MGEGPTVLVTNDDGIGSRFLIELASALSKGFEVYVCAPDGERSWVGHAISRKDRLVPESVQGFGCSAWKLNGTPADCVNLAIGHLLPRRPDLVISGINLGYNVTWPMILSSGTVGGALEGALDGLPSMAVSMALPAEEFDAIRDRQGKIDGSLLESLRESAQRASEFGHELMGMTPDSGLVVHNLNFPENTTPDTSLVEVEPAQLHIGSLFTPDQAGGYQLLYRTEWLENANPGPNTDLAALKAGQASHARLNFANAISHLE